MYHLKRLMSGRQRLRIPVDSFNSIPRQLSLTKFSMPPIFCLILRSVSMKTVIVRGNIF